jgi:predicted ATPase/class 3 adenylate cyclase/tetratricopeptide (TPR) repeat protein
MPEQKMRGAEDSSTGFAIEPLTRREREILALLAEGLTSPEIAEKLTLATSSVKSHVQHLYGKLGVSSKRQAVARGRELGLLGTPATAATSEPQAAKPGGERLSASLQAIRPGQPFPTGTVTFLLTDIEGSTRLRQAQPAAYRISLVVHDTLLREAIESHGGHVFRTLGDNFCAAFATAAEALQAALAAQQALHEAKWGSAPMRVHIALHTGDAELRVDGHYDGFTLARAARLLAAGHGGQTLLSAATQTLVHEQLPAGASLRDLGEYRLNSLARPENIFQLVAPGLPDTFPALKTLDSTGHNLPLQLTSFIGREHEISEARRLLHSSRLLTLTGPGGTGKTRLALQVAAEMLTDFPHGAWLVELAPIAQPELVPQAVAQALALRAETDGPLQQVLAEHLRDQTVLLILDNCEHLVEACAQLADQLLRAAPGLRILATSREALGIAGESSYPVPPLSLPDPRQLPPLETLVQSEAARLFVERTVAVRPDFTLTDEIAPAVAQICRRLDGIPLAIELAAARVRALSVEQIAARLDDRFRLLAGGNRTSPPRQQTLRGAIDWSYELLADAERVLLRRLAVFTGGWTLEAAEQVAAGQGDVLDPLTQLVGKSLVLSEERPGQAARFGMLETIREYAHEKLTQAGEAEAMQGRHLAFYLALAEEAAPELRRHGQLIWMKRLDQENDNLRAALSWALKTDEAAAALRLTGALIEFWNIRFYGSEGRRWLETALNLQASHGSLARSAWRARALVGAGGLAGDTDLAACQSRVEESLSIYRELGDKAGMAYALLILGALRPLPSDSGTALRLYEEALELLMAAEDGWGIGICLLHTAETFDLIGNCAKALLLYRRGVTILGDVGDRLALMFPLIRLNWQSWLDGDAARARALLEDNLAACQELGHKGGGGVTLRYLFEISIAQGNYTQAREEALAIRKTSGHQREFASVHVRLGQVDYVQGRLSEARAHFEAGLKIFRELNDQNGMGWAPPWLGCVAYRSGDLDQAKTLIQEGLAIDDPDGYWPELAFALLSLGDVTRAQGEPAMAAELYARSLRIVVAHGVRPDVAQYLEGFAKLAVGAGQSHRAARLFGAAAGLREDIGTPVPPVELADHDQAMAMARAQLDPAAFSAVWAAGLALSWAQAAAYALELTAPATSSH